MSVTNQGPGLVVGPAHRRRRTDPPARWLGAWAGVVALAVLNGAVHRAYEPVLGELPAHQVSSLVLVLLVLAWAMRVQRRHPLVDTRQAVTVGAAWALLTVTFEFTFFHYVGGTSWQTLLRDYDLTEGRVWALVVAGIAAAPWLVRWVAPRSVQGHEDDLG